jgi:two-component system, cell cycle response regulator
MYDERLATEILRVLNARYPDRLHLHELKVALPGFSAVAEEGWLRAVDALHGNGKLTGKFLRSGVNELEDAAMLEITPLGRESLARGDSQGQVQLDARLNIPGPGAFDHDLGAFWSDASNEKPLSVIMVDIDHFKNINDTYGHDVGNEVLKQIAATAVAVCEGKANVYRYGGDEISILAQNYSSLEAETLAERLRTEIAGLVERAICRE